MGWQRSGNRAESAYALIAAAGPWVRGAILLCALAVLWLVAGPRGAADAPVTLGGPGLDPPSSTPRAQPAAAKRYVVHVAGAVRRPGVYRVRAPARLIDAVERAGGVTAEADLTQINLAARLSDGRQVVVPSAAPGAAGGAGDATSGGATSVADGGQRVSINSASAAQLETLDGVGPAMAAAIIKARNERGGFTSLDQLADVPGIGEKRLANLREQADL